MELFGFLWKNILSLNQNQNTARPQVSLHSFLKLFSIFFSIFENTIMERFHIVLVITGPSQGKLGRNAAECLLTLASLVIPNLSISLFTLLHYILCSVAPTLHGNSLQIWEAGAGATIANSSLFCQ